MRNVKSGNESERWWNTDIGSGVFFDLLNLTICAAGQIIQGSEEFSASLSYETKNGAHVSYTMTGNYRTGEQKEITVQLTVNGPPEIEGHPWQGFLGAVFPFLYHTLTGYLGPARVSIKAQVNNKKYEWPPEWTFA